MSASKDAPPSCAQACLHHGMRAYMCMPGGAKACNLVPGNVQLSLFTLLDSYVFKNLYATAINLVVLFLIFVIMVTIPSRGLPGRQQIDGTTFTVLQPCEPMF
jgi:hypothetical protein